MKSSKPIAMLCAALCCLASCQKEADMALVQKTLFEGADVRQVEVADAWPVTIVSDAENTYLELEYSAYLEDYISVKTEGNRLEMGFTGRIYFASGTVFKATLHTAHLETLKADDAAEIHFQGGFEEGQPVLEMNGGSVCSGLSLTGRQCNIALNDASQLLDFSFDGATCHISAGGASSLKGTLNATQQLDVELSGGSQLITFAGEAPKTILQLHDACLLNMAKTQVGEMTVKMSGASEATVRVSERITGQLTEASTLYYQGHPLVDVECDDGSAVVPL